MLRSDRILDLAETYGDLDIDSRWRKSFEFDDYGVVAFARAVEQAAYEAAINACRQAADTCVHPDECVEAIEALMEQEQPK